MSTFNIHNSTVEQLNDSGNNYKFAGKAEQNLVVEQGNAIQSVGDHNKNLITEPKKRFWSQLWAKVRAGWGWLTGWFTAS
jgi:hypothetical protein